VPRQTLSGVSAMSVRSISSASQTALTTAGGVPMQPASPAPLATKERSGGRSHAGGKQLGDDRAWRYRGQQIGGQSAG
jgi:hypothetical protein